MRAQVQQQFVLSCQKTARQRLAVFSVGVCCAVLFPLLWVSLNQSHQQQAEREKNLNAIQLSLSQLVDVERLYSVFVEHNAELKQLSSDIEQRGLVPADWTMRQIKLSKLEVMRAEAEVYLDSIAQSPTVYFIPERFEAKVADSKDDLFRWRQGSRDAVFVTILGRYYARKPQ